MDGVSFCYGDRRNYYVTQEDDVSIGKKKIDKKRQYIKNADK